MDSFVVKAINMLAYIHVNSPHREVRGSLDGCNSRKKGKH